MAVGPLRTQVYVDPLLSEVSIAFQNPNYIADIVFPEVMVSKRTGIYFKYAKDKFRLEQDDRAPGTRSQRVHYALSQATYGPLQEHALNQAITDEDREDVEGPLDLDTDATDNLTERILLGKEYDAKTILTTAGTGYTNSSEGFTALSGGSRFDDYGASNPVEVIRTAKDKVKKRIMKTPNTLIMGYEVFSTLMNHPQILERIKYSALGVVTADLLAKVFDIDRIIVAEAELNSANETDAADSMDYLWGKNIWVAYITPTPGTRRVSYGYTLRRGARKVRRWRQEPERSDFIEVSDTYQHLVMAIEAIFRVSTVIS